MDLAHETRFEVEVRTCAASGASAEGDRVADIHCLVRLHEEAREVAVYGFQTIGVAQDYVVSVSAAFKSCQTHFPGKCRAHGVAGVEFEVDAFVLSSESWTVAVRRGDEARDRHCVVRHVDTHVVCTAWWA